MDFKRTGKHFPLENSGRITYSLYPVPLDGAIQWNLDITNLRLYNEVLSITTNTLRLIIVKYMEKNINKKKPPFMRTYFARLRGVSYFSFESRRSRARVRGEQRSHEERGRKSERRIFPPFAFLPLSCIISLFRSSHVALRKKRRPLAV